MKRVLAFAVAVLIGGAWMDAPANAGDFTVRQCAGSDQQGFFGQFGYLMNERHLDLATGCHPTGSGRIGVFQDLSGSNLVAGGGGKFTWSAPNGVFVVGTRFTNRLRDANGIQAGLFGHDGTSVIDLDQGHAHDGTSRVSTWRNEGLPRTSIVASLVCHASGPCANNANSAKAFVEITDVEFSAQDRMGPTLNAGGTIWQWTTDGGYHRGEGTITVNSSDNGTGISTAWVEINDIKINFPAPSCPGAVIGYATSFTPCPSTYSRSRTLDTSEAPFREGINTVQVCVADHADSYALSNKACTAKRSIRVDNEAPAPPVNLRVTGGSDWRPANGFDLEWRMPQGQVAPIIGAVYVLLDPDTGEQAEVGYFEGEVEQGGPIEVPAVGEHEVVVFLLDAAYNMGATATTTLRFDDRPPSDVAPEPPSGWVSSDELPLRQEIQRAEAGGPSGVSGYSLAVSREGPRPPCETGICLAPELTLKGGADQRTGSIGGLDEGTHWISAVAVSGAHKASLEPGSTMVEVDRTPPESTISGVPENWVNRPVTLTVHSTDALSGMAAEPGIDDGRPATFLETDPYGIRESPGGTGVFTVASEGINQVRYWARDLAGNANDGERGPNGAQHSAPGRATVRIDMTGPEAEFESARDAENPERVVLRATDRDSGVTSASVSIAPVGRDVSSKLTVSRNPDGDFETRIPSDDMPPGAYELFAEVTDRAGNVTRTDRTETGSRMTLTLPLKDQTSLTAGFRGGKAKTKGAYGSRPVIEGRLASGITALQNQVLVVTETFAKGGRPEVRTSVVRTDGDGRYRAILGRGPSRTVRVAFAGTPRLARTVSRSLGLTVKGRITFKIKKKKVLNGAGVKMTGRVGFAGALRPSRGKLVAIQFLDPSRGKWRPVEVLRTRRSGRFSFRYRFRTIASAQRILFRAASLPEAGWPYAHSTSKPRSVTVFPRK